jgi:cell division protein FtsB
METTIMVAIVGALAAVVSGFVGAWASRRNARDTNASNALQAFIDDQSRRIDQLNDRVSKLEADRDRLIEEVAKKEREWLDERQQKHSAVNEAHSWQLRYEHDIGELKESHARELGEFKACYEREVAELNNRIVAQAARITELERHVERLESDALPPASD